MSLEQKKKKNLKQNRVNELYNGCMHGMYGANKNQDNTNSEEKKKDTKVLTEI